MMEEINLDWMKLLNWTQNQTRELIKKMRNFISFLLIDIFINKKQSKQCQLKL